MYKYPLFVILLLFTFIANAQNRTTIKGKVIDSVSKAPIEYATIAVLNAKDTTAASLITYAQTDKDGEFSLSNLPVGKSLKVVISFAANKTYIKFFSLIKGQTMDMATVSLRSKLLNEVIIKGERMPITVSKDTIEFDATAFKTRPNAMVEDLLKKLSGVEVDNDGKITVLGRDVSKVLIDGREFFVRDLRIATKNLEADLISKVQVYDDRENDPNHLIPDNEVNKIINLKFKKELKKAAFGKVYGGGGTRDHYQTGGIVNTFQDTLQVSLLGYTNNLNSTGFDYSDLSQYGGTNRGGSFGSLGFGGGAGNGRQVATAAGVNINTDYGKKLKMNLNYLYRHTGSTYNTITNRQQFINDTTATTGSSSDRYANADTHDIAATINYKPSEATQFRYNPTVAVSKNDGSSIYNGSSYTNFINPINQTYNTNASSNNGVRFNHTFYYNHYLKKKGSTLTLSHSFSYNPGNNGHNFDNQSLTSYLPTLPSYALRRRGDDESSNTAGNVNAQYHNTVSKTFNFDISASSQYVNELNKTSTYDYNPVTGQYDSFLIMLSSDLHRVKWVQNLEPSFNYNITKDLSINGKLMAQLQQVNNAFARGSADLNQQFFFLLPNATIRYKQFSAGYTRSAQLPNIGDMIPYSIVYSPLSSVTGNPGLKLTTSDNFSINYNKFDFKSGTYMFLSGGLTLEHNSIFRQRTINSQLVETSMPINRDGRYAYRFNGTFNKQIKKEKDFSLSTNSNLSFNQRHDFFVINRQDGYQDSYNSSFSQTLSLNYKDIIQLDPSYSMSHVYTTYSGVNYNNQSNLTHSGQARFLVYFLSKFNLEGNYSYRYNPQVAPGYQKSSSLLNLNLSRSFLKKDRGEIKLSCYDLLDQNISTYRYINENSVTDNQSQIIKRYFMLTLQFRFRKSSTKDDKREPQKGQGVRMPMGIGF